MTRSSAGGGRQTRRSCHSPLSRRLGKDQSTGKSFHAARLIDFGSFRRITQCWSGPGWDFNFSGACVNDDPENPTFPDGRIGVYCDAAPLPFAKATDYTGVEFDLPGSYDEATGEPYFAV